MNIGTCDFCGGRYLHWNMIDKVCQCRQCLEHWKFTREGAPLYTDEQTERLEACHAK